MIDEAGRALRLGTRGSQLALAQSRLVADQLVSRYGCIVDLVTIITPGDISDKPIAALGTTGVFVTALRDALLRGEVDVLVHSFKDLPTQPVPGVRLAAVPAREDPSDALIDRQGRRLRDLPPGSTIGTGSARRAAELRRLGLPVTVVPIRGNVDTRLRLVDTGAVDAVILAAAGLTRLGLLGVATEIIDPMLILPAPAQGALAVECRADDGDLYQMLATLNDPCSRMTTETERAFLARLGVGCGSPVGAYARILNHTTLSLDVLFVASDDTVMRMCGHAQVADGVVDGTKLGHELAESVLTASDTITEHTESTR